MKTIPELEALAAAERKAAAGYLNDLVLRSMGVVPELHPNANSPMANAIVEKLVNCAILEMTIIAAKAKATPSPAPFHARWLAVYPTQELAVEGFENAKKCKVDFSYRQRLVLVSGGIETTFAGCPDRKEAERFVGMSFEEIYFHGEVAPEVREYLLTRKLSVTFLY